MFTHISSTRRTFNDQAHSGSGRDGEHRHAVQTFRIAPGSLVLLFLLCCGCHLAPVHKAQATRLPPVDVPSELAKVALPDYVIEPPDVVSIDVSRIVSRAPQRIGPMDVLLIQATNTPPDRAISGPYAVSSDGTVNLGVIYQSVQVAGKTTEEARQALEEHLRRILPNTQVTISIAQSTATQQQITGERLVAPDGTVNLGSYGRVFVTGMTVDKARQQIQAHLSHWMQEPDVSLEVVGYNSKTYYIITEGAGFGDGVNRFPVTGNETVLDAIAQINGLSQVSSKKIWVSRPAPGNLGCDQILPVDWVSITKGGSTTTNYQVLPGDRIFVAEDHLIAFDSGLGKLLAPAERFFAFTLLGTQTVQTINRSPKGFLTAPTVIP